MLVYISVHVAPDSILAREANQRYAERAMQSAHQAKARAGVRKSLCIAQHAAKLQPSRKQM
jgi:hypothetical protein